MIQKEWIRHGECNQCGDCCRHATTLITIQMPMKDEDYARVRFGKPNAQGLYTIRGPVMMPCPKLEGNLCIIHDHKPQYCQDAPLVPSDVEGTRCSFWFESTITGEIRRFNV